MSFAPRLDILPAPQRALWPELKQIPRHFVLYGGTGLAVRIGHRQSVDFDFFTDNFFLPEELLALPLLKNAEVIRGRQDLLSAIVNRGGAVKLEFIGGLPNGRVGEPDLTDDGVAYVATLHDIAGNKMGAIWNRSAAKDMLDVYALLNHGMPLAEMLAAARAIYGEQFNPMISIRNLGNFVDGDLPNVPGEVRSVLARAAGRTSVEHLPVFERLPGGISPAK
ncbi:MAG: nucleotidyl transferase AbiEii/AbiGii toxin family protein [Limisphaerales bacterium]